MCLRGVVNFFHSNRWKKWSFMVESVWGWVHAQVLAHALPQVWGMHTCVCTPVHEVRERLQKSPPLYSFALRTQTFKIASKHQWSSCVHTPKARLEACLAPHPACFVGSGTQTLSSCFHKNSSPSSHLSSLPQGHFSCLVPTVKGLNLNVYI